MDAASKIRDAVARVALQRQARLADPALARAIGAVKNFQARRFVGTYADLLQSAQYQAATQFFLDELYNDRDYTERDAQFSRIAGTVQTVFPQQVVQTAVSLAELHALTEDLDYAMARCWLLDPATPQAPETTRYVAAWRAVGRRSDRRTQLETVLVIGQELDYLTRMPGLRLLLKMMRGPSSVAGLSSLQRFLESGFDIFAAMGRHGKGTSSFLATVKKRESSLIDLLFDAEAVTYETELHRILGQAR